MTTLATRGRRLFARRPHLHLWYAVVVLSWMMVYGGLMLLSLAGAAGPATWGNLFATLAAAIGYMAAELWPPADLFGMALLLIFWSPALLAPFGLTRPDYKELY